MSLDESSEKLLNLITKDGKCANLEKMLSNVENSKSLVNRPIIREENGQRLTYYPAHIVSSRAKDTDLERKLGILIQHGADIKQKHGKQGLTVPHILCYRKNPTLGLNILYDSCGGEIDFNEFLDNNGNTLLHALANPKEAKCTDGLKLMETVQFLCHRNLDFKAKNNDGKSFLDLVLDKHARPVVKKYIAHDFLAELESEDRKGDMPKDQVRDDPQGRRNARKEFSKKMTKDLVKIGEDFFANYQEMKPDKQREQILTIIKSIDAVLNQGKPNHNQCMSFALYNEGEKIISFLHDSPSMKLKEISTWEEHLETILIELKSMINKDEWSTQTSDKLFTLYTICSRQMALWHKKMQKEMWHWVPKNEDPMDTKWSQKRVIPKLGRDDGFDGWFYRNGVPLKSSIPAYFLTT